MSSVGLDSALEQFSKQADRVRQDLYYCDVSFSQMATRNLRKSIHAASYVYAAAALESYVNLALRAVVEEVNARSVPLSDVRLSLLAISGAAHFSSLQDVRGLKMWIRRVEVLNRVMDSNLCILDVENLPLDGRTIRPDHLSTIWTVFGFDGDPLPGPRHRLALHDIADSRNAIAHGEVGAEVIAGQKSISDTLALIERAEEVVLHFNMTAAAYLSRKGYLR